MDAADAVKEFTNVMPAGDCRISGIAVPRDWLVREDRLLPAVLAAGLPESERRRLLCEMFANRSPGSLLGVLPPGGDIGEFDASAVVSLLDCYADHTIWLDPVYDGFYRSARLTGRREVLLDGLLAFPDVIRFARRDRSAPASAAQFATEVAKSPAFCMEVSVEH